MKYKHVLRALTVSITLGLLGVASLPSFALAASEDIGLSDDKGAIGDEIEVWGDGFEESYYNSSSDYETYYIVVYFSDEEAEEGDELNYDVENYEVIDSSVEIDEYGEWYTTFTIPDELTDGDDDVDVIGGTYYIYVTYDDDDEIVAVAAFEVIVAEIELNGDEGSVGTEIEISGSGFTAYEDLTIEFNGDDVDSESGGVVVDSSESSSASS